MKERLNSSETCLSEMNKKALNDLDTVVRAEIKARLSREHAINKNNRKERAHIMQEYSRIKTWSHDQVSQLKSNFHNIAFKCILSPS